MAGWDGWAANIQATGASTGAAGVVIYCPSSGAIWGRSGQFDCAGQVHNYDFKADGKDVSCPEVNGIKFMFIRKTLDDDPCSIFKKGQDSLCTMKGPSGSRVAVFIKEQKPETAVTAVANYVKPHV